MITLNDTANKILDVAEIYTQTRGFNAFSYKDIQQEVGIKTSSIHYYFPTKQDLALTMIARYLERFKIALDEIKQTNSTALQKLQSLGDIFSYTAQEGKFCLCGMLATDISGMSHTVETQLQDFFRISETWIAEVIRQGIADKAIKNSVKPENAAAHFLAALEGGLLIARTPKRTEYLEAVIKEALYQIKR